VKFIEDMSEREKTEIKESVGSGLNNLGNTCYMNSTLQCFRHIPELKHALNTYQQQHSGTSPDMDHTITSNMGTLFNIMDGSTEAVTPVAFTNAFRTAFPQFAQRDEKGHYMQQDADECLVQLMTSMGQKLKKVPEKSKESNAIDYIFGGQMSSTLQCLETEAEPVRRQEEKFDKLRCFIDLETNYAHDGILKGLREVVELRSQIMGGNVQFQRTRRIIRLPRVLIVQFVRFFWRNDTQKKAKILRKVQFPIKLDVLPYTDVDLRASLTWVRTKLKEEQDKKLGIEEKLKEEKAKEEKAKEEKDKSKKNKTTETEKDAEKTKKPRTDVSDKDKEKSKETPAKFSEKEREKEQKAKEDRDFAEAVANKIKEGKLQPTDTSGWYELNGAVTHKGRNADSGHYVGWVRENIDATPGTPAGDKWLKFDDDVVSPANSQEILDLCGGGDWHMAYILFYRRIDDVKGKKFEQDPTPPTKMDTSS